MCHIDNICIISTTNFLDGDIQDYPEDAVDDIYADSDDLLAPMDQRWRPIAAIAGIIFVLAVIATVVIVNGGDSASTSATIVVPPKRSMTATPRPLPPETVTTVAPPPRQPSPTATSTAPTEIPPPTAVPVPPDVSARTFTYRVTGTKGLLDLVTVVYADAQGGPQTDFNVSLPWSKTVVMNPGAEIRSVVATSLTGHLNCSITDGTGQPVAISTSSAMIAACSR
ncbi:MAG: MmpS family transport accessory protein [Mycobacterium sp.]|uniref:MmpS family transport accessory protein n=1 Tax=Mycobacterium sp. TaxID=1785 RepID=UPI003BC8E5AF